MPYELRTKEELEKLDYEGVLDQYHSLVDWIKENKKLPFERNPDVNLAGLIQLILEAQTSYSEDFVMSHLADSLEKWGENDPDRVVIS